MNEQRGFRATWEMDAAGLHRDTIQKHLATAIAAYGDAEAAGWTEEAANAFFARCQKPIFVSDNAKTIAIYRSTAQEVPDHVG